MLSSEHSVIHATFTAMGMGSSRPLRKVRSLESSLANTSMLSAVATRHDSTLHQNLAAAADLIEASAWNDLVTAAPGWLRMTLGLQAESRDGALVLTAARMGHLLFNRVIGWHSPDEVAIAKLLARYKDLGIRDYWIHAHTDTQLHVGRMLKARGLRPYQRSWVKMLREVGELPAVTSVLTVRKASEQDGSMVASIVGPAFDLPQLGAELFTSVIERPRWHVLIAECAGEPAAAAAVYVKDEMAYFVFGATRPSFRKMGAQRLLMRARADIAARLGCRWLVTETGLPLTADEPNPSYHNMLWAGFRPISVRANFCLPGTQWSRC